MPGAPTTSHFVMLGGGPKLDRPGWSQSITESPFIPLTDQVRGFVFDVATGKLNEVTA